VRHELTKYSLTDIHPLLSAIATTVSPPAVFGGNSPEKVQIENSESALTLLIPREFLAGGKF